MNLLILPLLMAAVYADAANEELRLVIGVSRHGARSPQAIMPFNKTSEQFDNTTLLLATGFLQHKLIGYNLRKRMIDEYHFLPEVYNSSQVYVQATDKQRT